MSARRFVNLLVENHENGFFSVRRLNLSRHSLFYPTSEVAPPPPVQDLPVQEEAKYVFSPSNNGRNGEKNKQAFEVENIRLPAPIVSLTPTPASPTDHVCKVYCFPTISESKILCADQTTRTFLYNLDKHRVISMPSLHAPKRSPIAFSVAATQGKEEEDDDEEGSSNTFYLMERTLQPEEAGTGSSFQFEALNYRKRAPHLLHKAWHCDPLPLPPFICDHGYKRTATISSYAVVGNVICISAVGVGTYCFDTATRSWSHAGDWMLPFCGKGEYVPELNLWFGISTKNCYFPCASDLSPIVARAEPPKLGYIWEDRNLPEEWHPCRVSKLVSLGSGRFCITRFFKTWRSCDYTMDWILHRNFAVFSGLEVVLPGKGKEEEGDGLGLRMIKHKSRRYMPHDCKNTIDLVL